MSIEDEVAALGQIAYDTIITRDNFEKMLDAGLIEVKMKNGNWWAVRRNGQTRRWKRDPMRLRTPIKFGFRGTSSITDIDFVSGQLDPRYYRRKMP